MIELIAEIRNQLGKADAISVSTVVKTWNSAPRPAGSSMMVTTDNEVIGSVSGGLKINILPSNAICAICGCDSASLEI